MRMIYDPVVSLIANTVVHVDPIKERLAQLGFEMPALDDPTISHAEKLTEFAGRTCYQSFPKPRPGGNATYIDHIKASGHGSVFEHTNWTFLVEDVSLNLTHELVRHRAGMAFSQLSGRYVDRGNEKTGFVVPDLIQKIYKSGWPGAKILLADFNEECKSQVMKYMRLRDSMTMFLEWAVDNDPEWTSFKEVPKTDRLKMVRGAARSVLGGALETKIVVTANTRALRHILEMRASEAADAEICKMGMLMYQLVARDNHFNDYQKAQSPMGREFLTTEWEKV